MVTFFITTFLAGYSDHFSNQKKAKKNPKKPRLKLTPRRFYISIIQLGWIEHHCVCLSGWVVQVWMQQSYNQKWGEKNNTPTPGWKRWFWSASKQTLVQSVLCVGTWCNLNLQNARCVFGLTRLCRQLWALWNEEAFPCHGINNLPAWVICTNHWPTSKTTPADASSIVKCDRW